MQTDRLATDDPVSSVDKSVHCSHSVVLLTRCQLLMTTLYSIFINVFVCFTHLNMTIFIHLRNLMSLGLVDLRTAFMH